MEVEVVATLAAGAVLQADPTCIGKQFVDAYNQLQAAMEAAEVNTITCQNVCDSLLSAGPWVLKIASISHVYSDAEPQLVASLNYSLSACVRAASDACHEIYLYLQHSKVNRVLKARGMTATLKERCEQFRQRLEDIDRHISLAAFLRQNSVQEQLKAVAQDVAAIRSLQATLEAMGGPARSQDVSRVQTVARAQLQRRTEKGQKLEGVDSDVIDVAWSLDGRTLATGMRNGAVYLWRVDSGERVRVMECHSDWVYSVAWSPDGKMVVTGSDENTAAVWDVGTGERVRVLEGHTGWVRSVAWGPRGDMIATGSCDNTAALWNAQTGERVRVLKGHTYFVFAVVWSPDGEKVATGSKDKTAVLWSASTGERLMVLHGADEIGSVAWSPDGGTLATRCARSAVLFSVQTGQQVQKLDQRRVNCIAWHLGGKMLATGDESGTVVIHNVESGKEVRALKVLKKAVFGEFREFSAAVQQVAWSPDGSLIASAACIQPVLRLNHVALE